MRKRPQVIFVGTVIMLALLLACIVVWRSADNSWARLLLFAQIVIIPLVLGICASVLAAWFIEEERQLFYRNVRSELLREVSLHCQGVKSGLSEALKVLANSALPKGKMANEATRAIYRAESIIEKIPTEKDVYSKLNEQEMDWRK